MVNKNYLLALGLIGSAAIAQAQEKVLSLGFEATDAKHTTEWALTPGGTYGDWVNVKEGDEWNEQGTDAHSGEYALSVVNGDAVNGQQWQRGFKIGNLTLEDNTVYRVSFWMNSTAEAKASLSIGREYFDNELMSAKNAGGSRESYNYNFSSTQGEWKKISFLTYHINKAALDEVALERYGSDDVFLSEDDVNIPEEWRGKCIGNGAAGFLPASYFIVVNMYQPGVYTLDDIVLEKNATVAGVTYAGSAIRVDFGFPTNCRDLAIANGDFCMVDPSVVSVKVNGEVATPTTVEIHKDGNFYIFLDMEEYDLQPEDAVEVSFTPGADCPIVYNTARRPSTDTTGTMPVMAFANEEGSYDSALLDVLSSEWTAPKLLSITPENESFNLEASALSPITLKFDKPLYIDDADAAIVSNGKESDISSFLSLSDDGCSVLLNIPAAAIADGEYQIRVSNIQNTMGVPYAVGDDIDIKLTYEIGVTTSTEVAEDIYVPDWTDLKNGTFPVGWVSNDNGTIHQYGLTADGNVWDYNWGGNMGGGGCRAMTGYSGDFKGGAMYWRCMNGANELGTLTYGAQVLDNILEDGTINPEMDPNIALYLEPGKYQISFKMAAWCNVGEPKPEEAGYDANKLETDYQFKLEHPKYNFQLKNLAGEVVAQFLNIDANPSVHRNQNMKVQNATNNVTDFQVAEAGYYILEFSTTQKNAELLMGNLKLITMPAKGAYYKGLLQQAYDDVELSLLELEEQGVNLEGETKNKLDSLMRYNQEHIFNSPSEVEEHIQELSDTRDALVNRAANIDNFDLAVLSIMGAIEEVQGTKYENIGAIGDVIATYNQYKDTDATTLNDEELAAATKTLKDGVDQIQNVKTCTDLLTWGIYKASQAADKLGADISSIDWQNAVSDDRVIASAINGMSKGKLYALVANNELAAEHKSKISHMEANPDITSEEDEIEVVDVEGVDLTGFIQNPKWYQENGTSVFTGWNIETLENADGNMAGIPGFGGEAPSAGKWVTDRSISSYGDNSYDLSQTIQGLPAGIYTVVIKTRTPLVNNDRGTFYYNAQNEEGTWDKYIYAGEAVAPFTGAGGLTDTFIKDVVVGEDGVLKIGVHEKYVSGMAVAHEDGEPRNFWTGTSYVDEAYLYWTAPLEGFDYAEAATGVNSVQNSAAAVKNIFTVGGVRVSKLQKGINIVKMSDGAVKKIIVK